MSCLSVNSDCFSLLHNQAACTGSSEIAAYVTGPVLEISDGISLLRNTACLLLDTYTAMQREIFAFFQMRNRKLPMMHYFIMKILCIIYSLK